MPMSPRLLKPRAAGGFDPRSIAGNVMWMDPAVSSSLTIQTGVGEWRNLNTSIGGAWSQSVANNQPTLTDGSGNPATINGRQALFFDGTNDRLDAATGNALRTMLGGAPGGSLYCVARPSRVTGCEIMTMRANGLGSFDIGFDARLAVNAWAGNSAYAPRFSANVMSANVTAVISMRVDAAAGTNAGFVNRTTVLTRQSVANNVPPAFGTSGAAALSIGGLSFVLSGVFQGFLGEMVCYARDLSDAEHNAVVNYLMLKWGVA